ncbi:MAG: hypothetical protein F6J97_07535 [Leptolyngbya sp. SIO4C1]|nr:hypothetical protein [Leptolyngbya sp. SIO4C1]
MSTDFSEPEDCQLLASSGGLGRFRLLQRGFRAAVFSLVGLIAVLGLSLSAADLPAEASDGLDRQLATLQQLTPQRSLPDAQRAQLRQAFNPALAEHLGHSRLVTSSLTGHRLTGAHLFTTRFESNSRASDGYRQRLSNN